MGLWDLPWKGSTFLLTFSPARAIIRVSYINFHRFIKARMLRVVLGFSSDNTVFILFSAYYRLHNYTKSPNSPREENEKHTDTLNAFYKGRYG